MDDQLVVHLKTGHKIEGLLTRPLSTNDLDVEIYISEEQRQLRFALDEICTIRFKKMPSWTLYEKLAMIEDVETITGETFRVAVFTNRKFLKGFISLDQNETEPNRTVFFTFSGVRCRKEVRPIGEILQDSGYVTNEHLNETLKIQEELRSRRIGEVVAQSVDVPRKTIEKTIQEALAKSNMPSNVRVGDILVEAGILTREQVEEAIQTQEKGKKLKIGELLISKGLISEDVLLQALAIKFRLRFIDLETIIPSDEALGTLSEGFVNRLQVFPIEFDGRKLVVATSTPTDAALGDNLRFTTKYHIELVVASSRQITAAIDKHYHKRGDDRFAVDTLLESMEEGDQLVTVEYEDDNVQTVEPDSEVIALVNAILRDAYKREASDIHFEPGTAGSPMIVRYRVDGELMQVHKIAAKYKRAIISRIKIISALDITERRRPQSGKILVQFDRRKLEYRVEVTPIVGGQEALVLRLLSVSRPLPLNEMGLMPYNLERFEEILSKPYGMILCVGPTGSGKTTTLHSALTHINTPIRKIWTVEDPVEITQPGLCQVQVNTKIGYSFAEALRSFLRADPDVIMIGEMRDSETAKIAIEASLTGHLVFSTLHTNSAPETAVRLIDMGMDPFNFADALLAIIAQRLAKKLCDYCKKTKRPTREEYDELIVEFVHHSGKMLDFIPPYEDATLMEKSGCGHCEGRGYSGRIAIHELMIGTLAVKRAIREGKGADELKDIALDEGMWTLKMDGICKVFKGLTDIEHIRKVCL
jgi:type II secretory ATPase GspE/PulE/Tfp pilus assembly ATPase PilB-like protein